MVIQKLKENDFLIETIYLNQYKDVFGEDIFLSPLNSENNNNMNSDNKNVAFYNIISNCKNCSDDFKTNDDIFGFGNINSPIVIIPDFEVIENKSNSNFLHKDSLNLFCKILASIKINISDIYVSNFFRYINSAKSQKTVCEKHFKDQLKIINPSLVIALGKKIGNGILHSNISMNILNSKIHKIHGFDLMVVFHPDDILKNNKLKIQTWKNFQFIRDNYLK